MCQALSELRSSVVNYAIAFDADLLLASECDRIVRDAAAIESAAATIKAVAAARVADTEMW